MLCGHCIVEVLANAAAWGSIGRERSCGGGRAVFIVKLDLTSIQCVERGERSRGLSARVCGVKKPSPGF